MTNTSVAGTVTLTSAEQVLADKLSVLFSSKRYRRSKDLYDIWQIINNCSINEQSLVECLYVRGIYPLPASQAPFGEECYTKMEHAYNTLQIRDPDTEALTSKPPFSEAVASVGKFTASLMEAEV